MYVIGITGGVGSGKSYAAHRLQEKLGATLLIADELGHVVMEPGRSAYCQIVEHFGQNIVSLDGSIDRAALAEIVFSDARARDWLNQVIHPGGDRIYSGYDTSKSYPFRYFADRDSINV